MKWGALVGGFLPKQLCFRSGLVLYGAGSTNWRQGTATSHSYGITLSRSWQQGHQRLARNGNAKRR
jgi:hypothetical protein